LPELHQSDKEGSLILNQGVKTALFRRETARCLRKHRTSCQL